MGGLFLYAKQLSMDDYIKDVITNLNTKEIEIIADNNAICEAVSYIKSLHENDDGYVTIAIKKENAWYQYHYKAGALEDNIGKLLSIEDINLYVSPNSFYKPFRRIENVRKLNALYIDIDYYTMEKLKDLSSEQIIYLLDNDYFKDKVPEASIIVITGRGIAIYWLIEPVPYKVLPLWNAIQKFFLEELKEVGADPKSIDAARVMRLAGSTNQKSGQVAQLLMYNTKYKYSLREIQESYLPELKQYIENPYKKKKGRKTRIVNLFNLYSLHYARLRDLVKLQEIREGYCRIDNGSLIETGQREFMCFLYRYWACCYESDKEKALESTLEFNKGFKRPLTLAEVKKATKSAEKAYFEWLKDSPSGIYKRGGYNYKNETLIKRLNITDEEMMAPLETIINAKVLKRRTNIRTNEHHKASRRNENGLTKREQEKLDKMNKVKGLKEKGVTQKEIAKDLNMSERTVRRYYKEIETIK